MPNEPPYRPGFGLAPPLLAGRDDLVADICGGLSAGPGHPMFVSALIGHRGVGKTSLLDRVGSMMERGPADWPVVHVQASRDRSLLVDIAEELPVAASRWASLGRSYRRLEKELTVKVNLGVVSGEAKIHSPAMAPDGSSSFNKLIESVGRFADDHRTGLLVTVDEASGARSADLASLAGTIQTQVNRKQLPVAFLFSGLPSFREAIAVAGTFAERLSIRSVEDLGNDAVRLALVAPAAELGVTWDASAQDLVVERSGGHAYYVQLFGYHAWQVAAGSSIITGKAAAEGIRRAEQVLDGQFEVTWSRLRPQEQAVLKAVADLGGEAPDFGQVPMLRVAMALHRTTAQLDVARSRLVHNHGLLRAPFRGYVQFASRLFADWIGNTNPAVRPGAHDGGVD